MREQYKYLDSFIDEQRSNGKYSFTTQGLSTHFGVSENALNKALYRLRTQGLVVMIRRGFYVIVPPEYRAKGIIPASLYINDLMKFLNRDYYIGLLYAAAYHGAGHQQPQKYSIITEGIALRPIKNDKVNIQFYIKKRWNQLDVIKKKVDTGYINISSPELTALDLVNYHNEVGGFNRVATVIEELAEIMKPKNLVETAKRYNEISVIQRLGYILEILGEKELSQILLNYLGTIVYYPILLQPKNNNENMISGNKWKVVENIKLETDL